ncbi:hypothetical protein BOTBODRAFT_594004 [Botryobasidium botryosum FD-172 SS1]|uniref:Uncharacterized protein n=1 Tax=Botryobasidium botryosum (strain FD-172 SS1) TaxID=930990 RepID=A0A067M7D5_BOTB1|nr:hypothetical protein BOTBODRAFT_594004 [Botryobasidium botryosum FD-172 SS1]
MSSASVSRSRRTAPQPYGDGPALPYSLPSQSPPASPPEPSHDRLLRTVRADRAAPRHSPGIGSAPESPYSAPSPPPLMSFEATDPPPAPPRISQPPQPAQQQPVSPPVPPQSGATSPPFPAHFNRPIVRPTLPPFPTSTRSASGGGHRSDAWNIPDESYVESDGTPREERPSLDKDNGNRDWDKDKDWQRSITSANVSRASPTTSTKSYSPQSAGATQVLAAIKNQTRARPVSPLRTQQPLQQQQVQAQTQTQTQARNTPPQPIYSASSASVPQLQPQSQSQSQSQSHSQSQSQSQPENKQPPNRRLPQKYDDPPQQSTNSPRHVSPPYHSALDSSHEDSGAHPPSMQQNYSPPFPYDYPESSPGGHMSRYRPSEPTQRIPDRSLPVQEEADDDREPHPRLPSEKLPLRNGNGSHSPSVNEGNIDDPGSPTPSSTLINPDTGLDSMDEHEHFTPRSPVAPLPYPNVSSLPLPPYPSLGYSNSHTNTRSLRGRGQAHQATSIHHALLSSQLGAMPVPLDPRQYAYFEDVITGANIGAHPEDPRHGDTVYNRWNLSELASPLSSSYNHFRPAAPIPPTPHSASAAPTPHPMSRSLAETLLYNQAMTYGGLPGGRPVPSAPSSYMSSPYPQHNPFLPPPLPPQSIVSSPSHEPLPLPPRRRSGLRKSLSKTPLNQQISALEQVPRAESTEPLSTEPSEDGDSTEREAEEEEEDVWIEEDDEDLLDEEYHPRYLVDPVKRRRKFQQKWQQLLKIVSEPSIFSQEGCANARFSSMTLTAAPTRPCCCSRPSPCLPILRPTS